MPLADVSAPEKGCMNGPRYRRWIPLLLFSLVAVAGIVVHTSQWNNGAITQSEDIYYAFVEGGRLVAGVNPYERILHGNMRENDKYAAYLPLFYLLSAGAQLAGLDTFPAWLALWDVVFLGCNIGIGYLIFRICAAGNQLMLGTFGALFWLFNRWTLHVNVISHIDFIPLFLLLLSLSLVPRRFPLACILFGASLAIKQVAVFALPLYLIWSWQMAREGRVRHLLTASALVLVIPFVASLPFLIWNAEGFARSVMFSATRYPADHFSAPSLDALFGVYGIPGRIPMVLLLSLTYGLASLHRVPVYASLLLVMSAFFGFNSVLFRQYVVWFIPFIPLTALEAGTLRVERDPEALSQ